MSLGKEGINLSASQDDADKVGVKVIVRQEREVESVVKIVAIRIRDSITRMLC